MMKQEFEKLTGIYPSDDLYKQIEEAYMTFNGDKATFCKAYAANTDGLAEKIQATTNRARYEANCKADQQRDTLTAEIISLKERLERELEWHECEIDGNVKQSEYDKLASDSTTEEMTDERCKELLYGWYGFAKEKIKILRTIPKYEVNRHHTLRQIGEIDRRPLYNATDWNYIRFDCGCMSYELINDNLRPFLH